MSLRSKLDRAIVAYLKDQGVAENVYPGNYSGVRVMPCVTVVSHSGVHEIPSTGIYRFQVRVRCQNFATVEPDETNPDAARVELDELTLSVNEALLRQDGIDLQTIADGITDSGRALAAAAAPVGQNNTDMTAFTLSEWDDSGLDGGNPSTGSGVDGSFWCEDLLFEAVCCASNTD